MKSTRSTTGLFAALAVIGIGVPLALLAGPPADGNWRRVPALSDEFIGRALDAKKWHDHNPGWLGREPALFSKKNVAVEKGQLCLTARAESLPKLPEGYHSFTTAAVKSKVTVKYAYFEVRCRPMVSRCSSSFWLYDKTPESWTEIDGYEIGGAVPEFLKTFHMDAHVFYTPTIKRTNKNRLAHSEEWEAPVVLADDFHVYGLEWDEHEIKWFFDGKLIRTLANTYWHQPLHVVLDSETMPKWFGLPKEENLPAVYRVDYIRCWQRADAAAEPKE